MSKFYRTPVKSDRTSLCPVCSAINKHMTGQCCEHVAKVTAKGIVFYWWGFRPEGFTAQQEARP